MEKVTAMAKHRLERVNELLRRELGELLRREMLFDAQLVTVQQVDITPDLKHAHVYMSVIGTPGQRSAVITQLQSKRSHLQYQLSRRVIIKYTPQLHFKLDTGIERGTRVIHLMDELNLLPPVEEQDEFGNPKLPPNF
jgi:ribosome-binding factor A